MDIIVINGKEYGEIKKESNIKICVLQRGWVAVGRFSRIDNDCTLEDASIIREWGTTKGLGELVNGPTDKTILDIVGTMRFDYLTLVFSVDCEVSKWEKEL